MRFERWQGTARGPEDARSEQSNDNVPPDIVFIVKRDGTILYLNRGVKGGSESELQGTSVFAYTLSEHHDDLRQALDTVFSGGRVTGYESAGVEPFVEGAWYQCRVAPNVREGKVVSATIIARDISRWKLREQELVKKQAHLEAELARVKRDLDSLTNSLAERECRQNELDRFRNIMDQAGEAIFITDPETGQFVDANQTACDWLGFTRDKLLTLGVRDLDLEFPLESPDGVFDHITDTRHADRPRVFGDGTHRRRNGTYFPVEVALARRMFGDREYMLVVARDIKERRYTERALRESEVKYRSLFELSRDAIYLSSRDGKVADVNDAALDLFGYSRSEFLGLEARTLYVRAEDIRTFQNGVGEAGSARDLEVELKKKGGDTFTALLTATLRYDGDANILGYQCIIRPDGTNGKSRTSAERDQPVAVKPSKLVPPPVQAGVLVIDGDKRVLTDTKSVLERAGISVVAARTLAAGVEVLRSQPDQINSVLLEVDQEHVDHVAAIEQLRSIDPRLHVVFMGEGSRLEGVRKAAAAVGADVMPKPIHPLALIQHVRDALAAREP